MTDSVQTTRYAVVGHPIAHSRSPFIHTLFAAQCNEPLTYTAVDVAPEHFVEEVRAFRDAGGRGLNVTVPHKESAYRFADSLGPRAARAGAVNTLRFDEQGAYGDNTDGPGLVRDLEVNLGVAIAGARVLMLGAGGASRGVLGPLLDRAPMALLVANRTASRATELAQAFADQGPVAGCGLEQIPDTSFDLVINATATGLSGAELPLRSSHLAMDAMCYDMMYAAIPTVFMSQATALGAARVADGRGMLVEQAAESFYIWRGVRPQTAPVIEALTEALTETT